MVVGIWGATEHLQDAIKGLRSAGADEVVVSFAEAVVQIVKFSSTLSAADGPACLAPNEEERIAAMLRLGAYLRASHPAFDKLTRNVARTFNVPIALVTLIDRDRQHFKAKFGLPAELDSLCDIPRSDAVCNHVVADDAALIVENLARDRRFAKNALLKKYHLRFYAGTPLHAPNGQPVGALCILDTKPRSFAEADRRLFEILGAEASDLLAETTPIFREVAA